MAVAEAGGARWAAGFCRRLGPAVVGEEMKVGDRHEMDAATTSRLDPTRW